MREPPPKPVRPAVPEDDDPTMRVWLADVPVVRRVEPPPLPSAPRPSEQTPTVALEIPNLPRAARRRLPAGPYAKIGAALFATGVLLGAVGAVGVMSADEPRPAAAALPPVATVAAPSKAAEAPKLAAPPAPQVLPAGPVPPDPEPQKAEPEPPEVAQASRTAEPPGKLPVSRSTAPTCQKLLGKSLVERNDPKSASRETRLANRELVRGNVTEAHKAYCLAHAWDRSNIDRRLNLARLYLVRRDWEKAAEFAQSALKLDSKNRRALGVLGDALAALHKTKEARAAWLAAETAPKATPSDLRLIVRRNMALAKKVERLQDFLLAERLYRRVLLLEPEHKGAMTGVAGCLLKVGDQRAAEAWALEAKRTRAG